MSKALIDGNLFFLLNTDRCISMVVIKDIMRVNDNKFFVTFLSTRYNENVVGEICRYLFVKHKYYRRCDRFLIECTLEDKFGLGSLTEYTVSIKVQSLRFDDIFGFDYDDDTYVFIYDGDIKHQIKPYGCEDQIWFSFRDISKYGIKGLIDNLDIPRDCNQYIILRYLYVDFSAKVVFYEISDIMTNPLFDVVVYNGKVINEKLYKWFVGNNTDIYRSLCELHRKFMAFIEWLSCNYIDDNGKINDNLDHFINNYKSIVEKLNLDCVWEIVIEGHSIKIYYTEDNEIIATYDIRRLSEELDRLKTTMIEYKVDRPINHIPNILDDIIV